MAWSTSRKFAKKNNASPPIIDKLNEYLRPSLIDKVSLFHDLEMDYDLEKIMEYNSVMSLDVFVEYEKQFWVNW